MYGPWSSQVYCPADGVAEGFETKVEESGCGDCTGFNSVRMTCTDGGGVIEADLVGPWGSYALPQSCYGGYSGIQVRAEMVSWAAAAILSVALFCTFLFIERRGENGADQSTDVL